jgi:hypothetical protein
VAWALACRWQGGLDLGIGTSVMDLRGEGVGLPQGVQFYEFEKFID